MRSKYRGANAERRRLRTLPVHTPRWARAREWLLWHLIEEWSRQGLRAVCGALVGVEGGTLECSDAKRPIDGRICPKCDQPMSG